MCSMSTRTTKEWLLPASIPFKELKGKDLEECVYWLLDAMGAKDLEWRVGGSGGGAADGGRDLEAHFFVPIADGEINEQIWWIECKGRNKTVEQEAVKSSVVNSMAFEGLDYLVIASNTQFSNPTQDWVKEWQKKYPKPKVELWDKAHLERFLSRHPDVVLRLFSEALSVEGRFQAMDSRFWNKLEFVTPKMLGDIWKAREDINFTAMGVFAVIVNEFANGKITRHPWGVAIDIQSLLEVLQIGLVNVPYLLNRSSKGGVDATPICRAFAYLLLVALDKLPAKDLAKFISDALYDQWNDVPEEVQEFFLMPIVDQLLSEMKDVCSADCQRISIPPNLALTEDKDEIEDYWQRFEPEGINKKDADRRYLVLEGHDAPCMVGFTVDKDNSCPLFDIQPTSKNIHDLLDIIKKVAAFRKAQATKKRKDQN